MCDQDPECEGGMWHQYVTYFGPNSVGKVRDCDGFDKGYFISINRDSEWFYIPGRDTTIGEIESVKASTEKPLMVVSLADFQLFFKERRLTLDPLFVAAVELAGVV